MTGGSGEGAAVNGGQAMTAGKQAVTGGEQAVTGGEQVAGRTLPVISDEFMRQRIASAQRYTVVLLRKTPQYSPTGSRQTVWEHGRRNMALGEHGVLAIVLPVDNDPADWAGLGVFTASPDEVREIMDNDPGVKAGIFSYEIHPVRGFPGSSLPT